MGGGIQGQPTIAEGRVSMTALHRSRG